MTRESFQFPACLGVPDFQGLSHEAEIAVLPSGAIATAVTPVTMTRESFQFPACLGVPDFQGLSHEAEIAVLPSGAIATALPSYYDP
jgi:DNA gyrase inhibitor GyrI